MTNQDWREIEGKFRLWSFRVYYDKSFAAETDSTLRFVKALVASCQPIRDRQAVIDWYSKRRRGKHADAQTLPT